MVTLYRTPGAGFADTIEEALRDMVIAHEVEVVAPDDSLDDVPASSRDDLPVLLDDGVPVTGEAAIKDRLDELRTLMSDWDKFQSDACYIDEDGTVC